MRRAIALTTIGLLASSQIVIPKAHAQSKQVAEAATVTACMANVPACMLTVAVVGGIAYFVVNGQRNVPTSLFPAWEIWADDVESTNITDALQECVEKARRAGARFTGVILVSGRRWQCAGVIER